MSTTSAADTKPLQPGDADLAERLARCYRILLQLAAEQEAEEQRPQAEASGPGEGGKP